MRGLAALAVLVNHSAIFYNRAYTDGLKPNRYTEMLGVYGVAVFFAISGYLMSGQIQQQRPYEFITRRVLRIYPLFITATASVIIAHPRIWQTYDILSVSLAPVGDTRYALGFVEWTLVYEVFFYVVLFVISFLSLCAFIEPIALAWTLVVLLAAASGIPDMRLPTISHLPLMPANIGLSGGLLIPRLSRLGTAPKLLVATGLLAIAALATDGSTVRLSAGASGVFLIGAAAGAKNILPGLVQPLFRKLGDWSYAIYLSHIPILIVVFHPIFAGFGTPVLLMGVIVAVAAGSLLGQIDMAIHDRIRRTSIGNEDWRVKGSAIAFTAAYIAICFVYA